MKGQLQTALDNTDTVYFQLVEIANKIVDPYVKDLDALINKAYENVYNLSNDTLRELMLKISLKSFGFSSVKEKSALKAECAEMLKAEAYAKEYVLAEGAVEAKKNTATVNISDEIMTTAVYDLVANLLKVKLDECHRVVDTLKSVLTSRLSEAKLSAEYSIGE